MLLEIYTEMTPNPGSLKFVLNRLLLPGKSADFREEKEAEPSELAKELFAFPFVNGVFISNNFVTITKDSETEWIEIIPVVKQFLKDFVAREGMIIDPEFFKARETAQLHDQATENVEEKIRQLLDTYVKPAVSQDGGNIEFKSFDKGIVTVTLQGACSGCPSSTLTLKSGIEGLLKRMVPEVQEVVAEEM